MAKAAQRNNQPKRNTPKPAAAAPASKQSKAAGEATFPWIYLSLVATFILYLPYLSNGLTNADDQQAILENELIRELTIPGILRMFSNYQLGMYAPVTQIVLAIGYAFGDGAAKPFHVLGLIIHLINGWLVFRLLTGLRFSNLVAWGAATIFLFHPVNTQVVAWASGMSASLCSLFYLAACLQYCRWLDTERSKNWMLCFLFFILAVLSKSAAVTLPLVLGLIHWWRRPESGLVKSQVRQWPFYIPAVLFGLLTFISRNAEGQNIIVDSAVYTPLDRFWMVFETLQFYLGKLLFPLHLSIHYPFIKDPAWAWYYYVAPLTILGLSWLVYKMGQRYRWVYLAAGLFILPVLVMLPIITVGNFELKGDRYIYISSIGMALLLSQLLLNSGRLAKNAGIGILAVLVIAYAVLVHRRSPVWDNSINLWTESIELEPRGPVPYSNRGTALFEQQKNEEALADFREAIRLNPNYTTALFNIGNAEAKKELYREAIGHYDRAIRLKPDYRNALRNRGNCKHMLGDTGGACSDWRKAKSLGHKGVDVALNNYCK